MTRRGADVAGLPRLRIFPGRETATGPNWDQIHEDVQNSLEELWRKISAASPSSLSRPGRTEAPAFLLFSYRVFFAGGDLNEDDPILVGVTIEDQGTSYFVDGEVMGEETGVVYFEDNFESPKDAPEFLDRVGRLVARLAEIEEIVLDAMTHKTARVAE